MQKKFIILGLLMIAISAEVIGKYCQCSQLVTQKDCEYSYIALCKWSNGTCSNLKEETTTNTTATQTCGSYGSMSSCHQTDNCGWTQAGVCANFTKCADYQYSKANAKYCVSVGSGCTIGSVGDTNVTCTDGSLDCTSIQDEYVCLQGLVPQLNATCVQESGKCELLDYSKCTTIKFKGWCDKYDCIWENSECKAPYCSYIDNQSGCGPMRSDDNFGFLLCDWVNNQCTDLDTSTLTQNNCFYGITSYTYYWSGTSCNACAQSSAQILVILGTLILMMI